MSELKTKVNAASVSEFLSKAPPQQQADAKKILALMQAVTKQKPKMWGSSMVGFGSYHYKSDRSSQEGDWPMIGFSPRKQNLTVYLMGGVKLHAALLKQLGPHKASDGSCLYLKDLSKVDMAVLKKIFTAAFLHMKDKYK